ncbi:hypothetical protein FA13DRAFT_1076731 [Coprinellus micaceus]|uniref:Uncharacterized protein n=1 Tax=Coprinellus micaceus TaxID=71717 RepID=A0A4Y7TSU6_COPMI|nr:hypothetical protein FA13DRAFT_1076731 [Coprinellus micaceus]
MRIGQYLAASRMVSTSSKGRCFKMASLTSKTSRSVRICGVSFTVAASPLCATRSAYSAAATQPPTLNQWQNAPFSLDSLSRRLLPFYGLALGSCCLVPREHFASAVFWLGTDEASA